MDEKLLIPVLVIDDDDFMLDIIKEAFDKNGIENYILCDNEEDFDAAIDDNTKIALIDHRLGGQHNGFDVIARFEERQRNKIPTSIIIMSGQTSEEVMVRYINERKVHAYVKKPMASDGSAGLAAFQSKIVKYTKTAIEKTVDWINWFKSLENFK